MIIPQDKPKSRLEVPPTQCPRCKTMMKVRKYVPLPGRKFVDVDYRCDECGAEVLRAVQHER
jgi:transposase-like protein